MIEKRRPRRKKPRINLKRNSNHIRSFDNKIHNNIPRTRGAIAKALEKYNNLAQDAQSNGDRIVAENFYQFAEHYQRLLNESIDDNSLDNSERLYNSKQEIGVKSNTKPSRTERASIAKSDRIEKSSDDNKSRFKVSEDNQNNPANVDHPADYNNKKKGEKSFTSDGIEALKPFEI